MKTLIFLALVSIPTLTLASEEVGNVVKIMGGSDAYLQRASTREALSESKLLEQGDEIHAESSHVVIHIYPSTQVSLSKGSVIRLSESYIEDIKEDLQKSFSLIDFVKGLIRVQVTKDPGLEVDQKIKTRSVTVGVRGTEFEISEDEEDFELDVMEGEVSVASNDQGSATETVKVNQGLKFNRKEKRFQKRAFRQRFRDHPGFMAREAVRSRWKQKREQRRLKKQNRRGKKEERQGSRRRRDR